MTNQFSSQIWYAVFFVTIACTGSSLAADARSNAVIPAIRWQVPAKFPVGVETIVSGRGVGLPKGNPGIVLLNTADGRLSVAQRDGDSDRFLWFAAINKETRGQTISASAKPVDVKNIVSIHKVPEGFEFRDGDRRVMHYQRLQKSLAGKSPRANYVHPLFGLDGDQLTQDFPVDHIHHRGIFWAWHQIYVGDRPAGDSWENKGLQSVVRKARVVEQGPLFATLELIVDWTSSVITDKAGNPTPIVEETTRIRLFHATANFQYVDFRIQLKPLVENVRIGGADNVKGYSGFTARIRPPREMTITDESGKISKDAVGTKSRWADVSGQFGTGADISGVAILSHRSLPQFPPKWLLRHYGMQNIAYPGRHPIALSAKKPLVLRHRLLLHRGELKSATVSLHQQAYEFLP
jgi:hypothetical protein